MQCVRCKLEHHFELHLYVGKMLYKYKYIYNIYLYLIYKAHHYSYNVYSRLYNNLST